MTKSLTEKWKDGMLERGYYYFKTIYDELLIGSYSPSENMFITATFDYRASVKEVLAPVPSYEEYKEIDNDLKEIASKNDSLSMECGKLERQLAEANELLLDFCSENECRFDHNGYCQEHDSCDGGYKCIQKDLKQYLKKWGVK